MRRDCPLHPIGSGSSKTPYGSNITEPEGRETSESGLLAIQNLAGNQRPSRNCQKTGSWLSSFRCSPGLKKLAIDDLWCLRNFFCAIRSQQRHKYYRQGHFAGQTPANHHLLKHSRVSMSSKKMTLSTSGSDSLIHQELLTASQVASLIGVGKRSWWRYVAAGRAPKPVQIGGSVRWRLAELNAWIEAGCPQTPPAQFGNEMWPGRPRQP